jgi:hypothetical protein
MYKTRELKEKENVNWKLQVFLGQRCRSLKGVREATEWGGGRCFAQEHHGLYIRSEVKEKKNALRAEFSKIMHCVE